MLSRVRVLVPTVTFVLIAALLVVPRANAAFTDGEDAAGAEIPALAGISGGTTTTDLPAEEELPVDAGTPVEVPTPLPAPRVAVTPTPMRSPCRACSTARRAPIVTSR